MKTFVKRARRWAARRRSAGRAATAPVSATPEVALEPTAPEAVDPAAAGAGMPGYEVVPEAAAPAPEPAPIADGSWICSSTEVGGLLVLDLPAGAVERISVDALADRLEATDEAPGTGSAAAPLPTGWVGRVARGRIEVDGPDGTQRLDAAALAARLPSAPPAPTSWDAQQPPRNPLRDPEASAHLLAKGWYRLPLLDEPTIALLRERYGEVHGWERAPSALGEGAKFEPDAGNPNFEYRARASEALSSVLEPLMRPLFDDFEPFIWGFYCKWPEGEATALHWDWSCVDQRAGHRSYQVWIALEDIHEENGQLAVLSGSHNVVASPRGSGLSIPSSPTFLDRNDEAIAKCDTFVMRAGDAIVFDQGLLHISFPNSTDQPRLACAGAWRPAEAELVHFQRVADDVAIRYQVDDWWFRNMHPGDLGTVGSALGVSEALHLGRPLEDADQVAAFLDQVG